MKRSELTFMEGFTTTRSMNSNPLKAFDWNKAAEIIKIKLVDYPNLTAEAGLQGGLVLYWRCYL